MTATARLVLGDCEKALKELITCDCEGIVLGGPGATKTAIGSMRRRRWVTVVALLRAVGHVLKNVDGEEDSKLRKIIAVEWKALINGKPEPHIFWDFIENERNTIIKEYKFRSRTIGLGTGVTSVSMPTATGVVTLESDMGARDIELRILTDGHFAARNDVDVASEAVNWWKTFLDRIDDFAEAEKASRSH
jgi:hypothetical protein